MHKIESIAQTKELKSDARFFKLVIRNDMATTEEKIQLWHWFWKHGKVIDRRGRTRIRLIRDISDEHIVRYMDEEHAPARLMERINQRLAPLL